MNVLLGVGGSELSVRALETTIERATEAGDRLTVAVYENERRDRRIDAVEAQVEDALADVDFEAEVRRIEGEPGPALVEIADDEGFDRIVVGSGQQSPLGKIQLGSTAEFVLLNAQVPVTLVR